MREEGFANGIETALTRIERIELARDYAAEA
jgi:hypothetical protein